MAYYAALVSVVELLKEITCPDSKYILDKQHIHVSLYEKFNLLLELLEAYSPSDHKEESNDILEKRIRDAAYRAEYIIESHISHQSPIAVHHTQDIIGSHISHQIPTEDKPCGVKGISRHFISAFKKAYRKLQPHRLTEPTLDNTVEKEYSRDLEKVKAEVDSFVKDEKLHPQRFKEHTLDNIVEEEDYRDLENVKAKVHPFVTDRKLRPQKEYYRNLKKVRAEVVSIVEELMTIKARPHLPLKPSSLCQDSAGGAAKVQVPSGRNTKVVLDENLVTTIKDQLCGEPSRREVISIVGMGGLGKSTLARSIFEDKLIDEHFDCRAWVTVSQNYRLHNILQAIVDSLNIKMGELVKGEEGVLVEHIYKHLKGRRYLIVMDDMWETKVWDDVKRAFPNDNNGSRVITTTRLSDVAFYADSCRFIHQLQLLDEEQSWNLFTLKVLCPLELEDIGRVIAKKCRGLPLAIVVVAGLLSKINKTRHDWEEIARNVSAAAGIDENFSKILSLSYKHLPHHLKPCFLYLGGFPEDYKIPVSKLIKLWVAEGFLKPIASKSLEESGEEYLSDLVSRNLVLTDSRKGANGKFITCSIHDVLRDLCLQRAHYENFLQCIRKQDFHGELCRLYIQRSDDDCVEDEDEDEDEGKQFDGHDFWFDFWGDEENKLPEMIGGINESFWLAGHLSIPRSNDSSFLGYKKEHISHIRTIPFFANDLVWQKFLSVVSDFKLLRVLDTTHFCNNNSLNEIIQLFNLRYLALQRCFVSIPPSIFKLQYLQTLIVDGKPSSITLPCEIWKMPRLRHVISDNVELPPIPPYAGSDGIPLLGKLQTLCKLRNFIFTINAVEMIPNLRKLSIRCNNWVDFGLKHLVHLDQLESLEIRFPMRGGGVVRLPTDFAFPSNLRELKLFCSDLPWKDMTLVGSLPNLEVLHLGMRSFVGKEWETIEGEFSRLKTLRMTSLHELRWWQAEDVHFPCLEQLYISYCPNLEEIPPGIGEIPTLQSIELYMNREALNSSALRIQEEQLDLGNDLIQFRIQGSRIGTDSDSDFD